jgi:hypothetical protein
VSLRQIATATKISVGVLEALERNDISRLPGGIFSRAFVRSYAVEVGLDPEATVQDFIASFPEDSVAAGHPVAGRVDDEEQIDSDRRSATTFVQLVLLSVPVAAAIWFFGVSPRRAAPGQPAATVEAPLATVPAAAVPPASAAGAPAPGGVEAPAALARGAAGSVATAGQTVPAVNHGAAAADPAAADRLTIGLSVKRPCWISATVDGQRSIERLVQPGERRTLDVGRELVLTAGDGGAVEITINGVEARPIGRAGEVVTARFTASTIAKYLPPR